MIFIKNNDKFYTKKENIEFLISLIDFNKYDLIIEPSAGNGSFLSYLPKRKTVSIDIEPEHKDIKKLDFFSYIPDKKYKNILTIGNPPFGKNSSLAVKFFNHASTFSKTIAFILPKTFRKSSVINRLHKNFHLHIEKDLITENFDFYGKEISVPAIIQVWVKTDNERKLIIERQTTKYFSFTDKDNADLAIRRVGFYAGTCYKDINKSKSSHYFIKTNMNTDTLLESINSIVWEHNNTVGSRSISKGELIIKLEEILKES